MASSIPWSFKTDSKLVHAWDGKQSRLRDQGLDMSSAFAGKVKQSLTLVKDKLEAKE